MWNSTASRLIASAALLLLIGALGSPPTLADGPADFGVWPPRPLAPLAPVQSGSTAPNGDSRDRQAAELPTLSAAALDLRTVIEGISFDEDDANSGAFHVPPDPGGAAGPGHLVSVVNTSIEWHTKSGVQQSSQSLASFFSSLNPGGFVFDPKVIYDQHAGRFVVVALERDDDAVTSRILLAVSDDSDPNGTWHQQAIDSLVSIDGTPHWADYPGLAVDEEAIYITANIFEFGGSSAVGTRLWIVRKTEFYSGLAAVVTVHDPFGEVGLGFARTMQPAHVFGALPGSSGTFLTSYGGLTDGTQEFLTVIRVDSPLNGPTFVQVGTVQDFVPVGDIDDTSVAMPDAPQAGTSALIETNDRRTLNAVWRNNALWVSTTVVPPSGGPDASQATAHWFKVDTSDLDNPVLADQGNVGGNDIDAGAYTFFPSLAVDADGNMAIEFALSSPNHFASAYFSGRRAGDSAGSTRPAQALAAGQGPYLRTFGGTDNRWGDYTGISLDPSDGTLFWVFNEYALTPGLTDGNGHDGRWGTRWGSLSLIGAPSAPTGAAAAAGAGQATVSWSAPTDDGGAPITLYTVTSDPDSQTATTTAATTVAVVTGLTNGTSYTFTVTATNAEGTSASSSPSNAVTPATVPDPPTNVTALRGNAQATVSWSAPADDGGSAVTQYAVTSSPDGHTASVDGATFTAVVTGLTNGTSYTFTVTATNIAGTGAASTQSNAVTPATVPDPPINVWAVAGAGQATVSWDAPAGDGGSPVTLYAVASSPTGGSATTTATTTVVAGLANGTSYTFTVAASNNAGTSASSSPSNTVMPATVPGQPTGVVAVAGVNAATVSWDVPADDGGRPIELYTVTSDPDGHTATSTAAVTTTPVTGLTNGKSYTFTVTAANEVGTGASSTPSSVATPGPGVVFLEEALVLPDPGDSGTLTVEARGVDPGTDRVQANIQHTGALALSGPVCAGVFAGAASSSTPVAGGTLFECALAGSNVASTTGIAFTFLVTRLGSGDVVLTFDLLSASSTAFFDGAATTTPVVTGALTVLEGVEVAGSISLQGVTSTSTLAAIAPTVTLTPQGGGTATTTVAVSPDGAFSFAGVAPGDYTLTATADGFVSRQASDVAVALTPVAVSSAELRAGLVNSDQIVNILDISSVASQFLSTPARPDGGGKFTDVNADGIINILDVSAVASNFLLASPQTWP